MAWTFYKYILKELLKLLTASVVTLMLVISFAAAIKPLSDGQLSPILFAKFVVLTAPTMLGFALPFAGAFASTLVFIRLVQDNEITACSASGMSYRAILMPVIVLGVALTMGLFSLSNFVIPAFFQQAEKTVQKDLITGLVSSLSEGKPYVQSGFALYANSAEQFPVTDEHLNTDPTLTNIIRLEGVAVSQFNRDGVMKNDGSAREAWLFMRDDPKHNASTVQIVLEDAYYNDPDTGRIEMKGRVEWPPMKQPNPFRDKPKFLSWPELYQLEREPERFQDIAQRKENLIKALAAEDLVQRIREAAVPDGKPLVFKGVGYDDKKIFEISAPSSRVFDGKLMLVSMGDEKVTVVEKIVGQNYANETVKADTAEVSVRVNNEKNMAGQPYLKLELGADGKGVLLIPDGDSPTPKKSYELPTVVWSGQSMVNKATNEIDVRDVMQQAESARYQSSGSVIGAYSRLSEGLQKLSHRIRGHLHERAAAAIACSLLLLLGAMLSMLFKHQMPLVVYFWSFLLAILSIIIMNSGQNMAGRVEVPLAMSLSLLWTGNLVLMAVIGVSYCKLAKN
ncbi:LptF/LptG family permease [Planctomycetota bacterium]|nr:LptF/LptG family permease [Planctomycetota bacterium]